MSVDEFLVRRAVVLGSALIYWGGVWVLARRIRKRIGRSPNVKPRGTKERLLWLGWILVVAGWIALPCLARPGAESSWFRPAPGLLGIRGLLAGLFLIIAGYAGTLWCYRAMGDHWRMGVDRRHKAGLVTTGPYKAVRHPIYLFQIVMLAGVLVLLPAGLPVAILVVHLGCVWVKARDEETHLHEVHGPVYGAYMSRTGMLFPPLRKRTSLVPR